MFRSTARRALHISRPLFIAKPKADSYLQGKPVKNYYVDEETNEIVIKVQPLKREGESLETMRKRLTYQSRKRGILETDLLMSRFAKKYLSSFDRGMLEEYDKLLDELDWDIYYWATENYKITPLPDKWKDSKVLKLIQQESRNEKKEILRMPSLN
ncbi:hypothetical protein CAS74_001295 [Pichia kudriavzevii]|uniref:Succinate dehydrogenase assembly factor 2, mitochondrial n=1 Tax=Pichia kudriavzevii TaxID=4909 RepID=A0A1Z8JRD2_PICKU|nr:hypothetical protein CAS74_001295 [Pichia kudriavzevii]